MPGAPASALGTIEAISDALAGLARFGAGALSDEPQRRRTLAIGGYTTTAVLSAANAPGYRDLADLGQISPRFGAQGIGLEPD